MKNITLAFIISTSLLLVGCGGGGSGDSGSPTPIKPTITVPTPSTILTKQSRVALEVNDITATYSTDLELYPDIKNQMGSLRFELLSTHYNDIADLDLATNKLTILNAGELTYKVTDTSDNYQTSTSTFTLKVNKAISPTPPIKSVVIDQKDFTRLLTVSKPRGDLNIEMEPASSSLLSLSDVGGFSFAISPKNSGVVSGFIIDSGNRNYSSYKIPFKIDIKETIAVDFKDIQLKYSMLAQPQLLSSGAEYSFTVSDSKVVSIDDETGEIQPLNTGHTLVSVFVTFKDSPQIPVRQTYYITVEKGERTEKFDANLPKEIPYSDSLQQLAINTQNQQGKLTYKLISGDNVSSLNEKNGTFSAYRLGNIKVEVTDTSAKYVDATTLVDFNIVKAIHPTLANESASYIYSSIPYALTISGQIGTLQLKAIDPTIVEVESNKIKTLKAGTTIVEVTDISELYQPGTTTLTVNIAHADRNDFSVKPVNQKFADGDSIPFSTLYTNANETATPTVTIKANPNNTISLDQSNEALTVNKVGSASLEIFWPQDNQYKESQRKIVDINITPAENRLTLDSNYVETTYQIDTKTINSPNVSGKKGELSYKIKDGSQTDVVTVDAKTGLLSVNYAGTTTIEITDSGNENFAQSKSIFTVMVHKAVEELTVKYPATVALGADVYYKPTLSRSLWDLNFTIDNINVAEVVNNKTGYIKLKRSGGFTVSYTGNTRNYQQVRGRIYITVEKEPHPGITAESLDIYYSPFEKANINVTSERFGTRTFILTSSPQSRFGYDFNTLSGEVSNIKDYPSSSSFSVVESESTKYEKSTAEQLGKGTIRVHSPKSGDSDKDYQLAFSSNTQSHIIDSRLNSDRFQKLQQSSFSLKGYKSRYLATSSNITKYGQGYFTILSVKPIDNDDLFARKAVKVLVSRFDGCESSYTDSASLIPNMAINYDTDGQLDCKISGESANYFTKITLLDDSLLTSGNWELVDPIVITRSGKIDFIDTPTGGAYLDKDKMREDKDAYFKSIGIDEQSEPRKVYEWNTINMTFSK